MTNTPKDAAEIASRLRRLSGLNQTQIDSLSLSLDPVQVDQINDSDLASLVNGTLPGLPLNASGGLPLGLPGAVQPTRFVGGTVSGAPTTGSFLVRDWIVDGSGTFYVCTVAGSPGTWVQVSGGGGGGSYTLPDASSSVKGGVRLTGDLAGTATSPVVVTGGYFDPKKSYGATYDGTTDDSAAIQAAIDAAAATGGGIVELRSANDPNNTVGHRIKVNTTLRMKTGVWLRGVGPTTVLAGTASPMIALPASGSVVDRITISDLFLQTPAGVGIKLDASALTGGYQLGWPRIVVERVTVADAVSHAFQLVNSAAIETRIKDCVSLRAGGNGFLIGSTDNVVLGCTAGAGAATGIVVQGGNNRLSACKSYGNTGSGFSVAGAGRHNLTGCEAQDNTGDGFNVASFWNTITGLADSNGTSGFNVFGNSNTINASAMYGGGGSGQVTPTGFLLAVNTANLVVGVSNCATPVSGPAGNFVQVNAANNSLLAPTAVKTGAYTAASGELVPVDTTSGAVTVTLPTAPADRTQIGVKLAVQGGTNAVTVARGGGSDVFNKAGGSTSLTLSTVNQTMVLQYAAATGIWYVRDSLSLAALDTRFASALNIVLSDTRPSSPAVGTVRIGLAVGGATAPAQVTGLAVTPGDTTNALSWVAPSNGGSAITGYSIYRSTSSGTETLLTTQGTTLAYSDTGLTNGTTYFYKVAAVNAVGTGTQSAEASGQPTSAAVSYLLTEVGDTLAAENGDLLTL